MKSRMLLFLVAGLVISGCNFSQAPTSTPTQPPTVTPPPTITPAPTQTPTADSFSIAFPTAGGIAPRWMILGQPGQSVEILGENWNYADDRWGETYGCIDYIREKEPYVFFEQCFAFTNETLSFESQRDSFLSEGFESLEPGNTFGDAGQISLLGKKLEDNSEKFVKFFEIIGVKDYVLLVEMNITTDEDIPLQEIYKSKAAVTIDYVLQSGLEKSKLILRSTPTPLSPVQEGYYAPFAEKLITEDEASKLYTATWIGESEGSVDGTWEPLGDHAASKRKQVCRLFEDRTNADVRWVEFNNCVFATADFPFEGIAEYYKQPGDLVLTSSHEYENEFALYGYQSGHTYIDGYLLDGEYIYYISMNSRTLGGESVEDVFTQTMDDFIYNVLMANLKH